MAKVRQLRCFLFAVSAFGSPVTAATARLSASCCADAERCRERAAVAAKAAFENHGGMWMPSQIPLKAEELKRLGLAIDPALLADPKSSLLGSIVNLNGCSASFVSKQGLSSPTTIVRSGACKKIDADENLLKTGTLARRTRRALERPGVALERAVEK